MSGEESWRKRVVAAWVVYGLGVVMCLGSLGMDAAVFDGHVETILMWLVEGPEQMVDGLGESGTSFEQHLELAFPLLGVLLSFAVLVPGAFGLWLAKRSKLFFWMGVLLFGVITFLGPVLVLRVVFSNLPLASNEDPSIELGLWLWCAGVVLTWVAFPLMGRPRVPEDAIPDGSPA